MTHQIFSEQTESQFKVLAEISTISKRLGIEFWLRGGWAIDFLLGKFTRQHEDIDLVTWVKNRNALEEELIKAGDQQIPVKEEFRNRSSWEGYQGCGYGKQSMKAIETVARNLELKSIRLHGFGHNHIARDLYEKS